MTKSPEIFDLFIAVKEAILYVYGIFNNFWLTLVKKSKPIRWEFARWLEGSGPDYGTFGAESHMSKWGLNVENLILVHSRSQGRGGGYFVPMGARGWKPWFPWPHYNPALGVILTPPHHPKIPESEAGGFFKKEN